MHTKLLVLFQKTEIRRARVRVWSGYRLLIRPQDYRPTVRSVCQATGQNSLRVVGIATTDSTAHFKISATHVAGLVGQSFFRVRSLGQIVEACGDARQTLANTEKSLRAEIPDRASQNVPLSRVIGSIRAYFSSPGRRARDSSQERWSEETCLHVQDSRGRRQSN